MMGRSLLQPAEVSQQCQTSRIYELRLDHKPGGRSLTLRKRTVALLGWPHLGLSAVQTARKGRRGWRPATRAPARGKANKPGCKAWNGERVFDKLPAKRLNVPT